MTGRRERRRKQLLDILRREYTENFNRQYYVALCGELALEEAMELS